MKFSHYFRKTKFWILRIIIVLMLFVVISILSNGFDIVPFVYERF